MSWKFFLLFLLLALFPVGCKSNSSAGAPILVTVTDQAGGRLPGATVVLGDSDGRMLSLGSTDAGGQIVFYNSPIDATITAGYICFISSLTYTAYSLDINYDVNASADLRLWSCSPASALSSAATVTTYGTATVNVTNALPGIAQNTIQTNQPVFSPNLLITQQTLTVTSNDLQEDGKLSIVVTGKDANGMTVAYGDLLDQTFSDGMTADITVDQPTSSIQYQVTNIPAATTSLCRYLAQIRTGKGSIFLNDCLSLSSAPTSTIVNMAYISGLGDQFSYGVSVWAGHANPDGSTVYSDQGIGISGPPSSLSPSDQIMDLSQLLTAPSNMTVSAGSTATPTLSWSGLDPRATSYGIHALFRPTSARIGSISIGHVSPARTHIRFPELPDSLAAFRPTGVFGFSVSTAADFGSYRANCSTTYTQFLP